MDRIGASLHSDIVERERELQIRLALMETCPRRCSRRCSRRIKEVFKEQWDDYQLKSLAHGGNSNLFNHLKEYGMENQSIVANYNKASMKWYRGQH